MEVQYRRFLNINQGGNCPVTPLPLPQSLYGRTLGRSYGHVSTKFSRLDVYQNFLPMVLRWRALRAGAPLQAHLSTLSCSHQKDLRSCRFLCDFGKEYSFHRLNFASHLEEFPKILERFTSIAEVTGSNPVEALTCTS